jgi:hypothetical protein
MSCGHGPSNVVWSHMWPGLQTKCYFNESLFIQVLTHDKIKMKSTVVNGRSAMVFRFCVRPTSKRQFLENSPSDHETSSIRCHVRIHVDFTSIILAFTYILWWSLKHSGKRTWTGSAFSTNESAWSVMVTGYQSRVWSGPNNRCCWWHPHRNKDKSPRRNVTLTSYFAPSRKKLQNFR